LTTTVDPVGSFNDCYAFDAYSTHCLRQGVIPFWNPYQGLGQPFLADGLPALFYPPNWLHLVLPPAWWDLVFLANWFLGTIFLYLYLRILDLEPSPALIGALSLLACGAVEIYLPLREVPAVAAWWPLLLYAIERTCREPGWRARHTVLAVGVFCSITGGQAEVTFISLLAIAAYALIRIHSAGRDAFKTILGLAPGAVAGLLLSAPHWLNFVDYAFSSYSGHGPGAGNGLISLPLNTVASYFFPYFYGRVWHYPFGTADFVWIYSPGWVTPLCLFLGFASLAHLRAKPRLALGFLWVVSALALAKFFNVPAARWLGSIPYLERVIFPRYAAFLPAFGTACLAAFGIVFLVRASHKEWLPWLAAWSAIVCSVFALGLFSIWLPLRHSAPDTEARQTFIVFGLGGLSWALIQPLGLWWVRYRSNDSKRLYILAAFGILLHGVALAPGGYSIRTYLVLSVLALLSYLAISLTFGAYRDRPSPTLISVASFSVVGLFPVLAAIIGTEGLPRRYNPLRQPPYMATLQKLQQGGLYRSYSLGALPAPEFASLFELSSLDNLDAISPTSAARFLQDYLDPDLSPLYFAGYRSTSGPPFMSALDRLKLNRRYYNLVAMRYLVKADTPTFGRDPNYYDSLAVFLGNSKPEPITNPMRAVFTSTTDDISTIEVRIGTYGRQNEGRLTLQLFDDAGNLLEAAHAAGSDLIDNAYFKFHFSHIAKVKGNRLMLSLEFQHESPGSMVAAYVPPDSSAIGFDFRVLSPERSFRLESLDERTGATIWENPEASPRVFLAPEIISVSSSDEALSRIDSISNLTRSVLVESGVASQPDPNPAVPSGQLREFKLSPNEVFVKYTAEMPGILTLVDAFSDGWHAEVNGKEAPVVRVDGAFRGVKIETTGEVNVRFWYRPPRWCPSLALCGLGATLLFLAGFRRRFSKPR
jgi:hypothetical protein